MTGFEKKVENEYRQQSHEILLAHAEIVSKRVLDDWHGAPANKTHAAYLVEREGLSLELQKMCYRRQGFEEMVVTGDWRRAKKPAKAREVKPAWMSEYPLLDDLITDTICRVCGSSQSAGAMFTTLRGGDVCDDCV